MFNLFINDFSFFFQEAELPNFADDSTIYVGSKGLTEPLERLRKECDCDKLVQNKYDDSKPRQISINDYKFQGRPKQICQIIRYRN